MKSSPMSFSSSSKPLTLRQQRFVLEYIETGNATESARRAGYANPNMHGSRMIVNDSIKRHIDLKRAELMSDTEKKIAWLTDKLTDEATDKGNGDSTRVRALEILGKIYGAYAPEKQEVTTYSSTFFADIDDVEQENPPENNDLH